jgi:spore coat polysaccharide biosynthesis protein SpsF
MNHKIIGIIQARMGSNRLPGKSLKHINGVPLLERIIKSQQNTLLLNDYIVATSNLKIDDDIEALCKSLKVKCYRGSENNVLERFIGIIDLYNPTIVVRLTGDNIFVDADLINYSLEKYLRKGQNLKYGYIGTETGFPFGLSLEIFDKLEFLKLININNIYDKEHVTWGFKKKLNKDKILEIKSPIKVNTKDIRLSLDTEEDLNFILFFLKKLEKQYINPNYLDILEFCKQVENETFKF